MKERRSRKAIALAVIAVALVAATVQAATQGERVDERGRVAEKARESIVVEPRVVPEPVPPTPPYDYGFDVDVWTGKRVYEIGDLIQINFRVTRPCYVYIFNTDTRGVTRQIFPNYYDSDNRAVPGGRYSIPDANYRLRVTGPPGREELRIVAVRDRATYYERRYRFSPQDPFPTYPEGAKGFLREYQREKGPSENRERDDSPTEMRRRGERSPEAERVAPNQPVAERGSVTKRPESIVVEPRVAPDTIIIEEPQVTYDRGWAEAVTTFHVVEPYWQPTPTYYGRLRISTRPSGARVYIDGDYRGRAPLTVRYLDPGFHSVLVTQPGFDSWAQDVEVREGREMVFDVRLRPQRPGFHIDLRF